MTTLILLQKRKENYWRDNMKILILMPLDERFTFIAASLYKNLRDEVKQDTFCMPMFSEWQMVTKKMVFADLPIHWNMATFGSLVKAKEFYKQQEKDKKDILIIGNTPVDCKFDMVFNFQDAEKDLPYCDKFLDQLKGISNDSAVQNILNTYNESAVKMTLHDYKAAGEFLSAYLKTDPQLDQIKEKYKDILHFKEVK